MPIYEYVCESCGRVTEVLQRVADPPPAECAHCGGALRRMVSAPAFQFKGSGWYVTDYARKSGGGAGRKSEASEKPASGAGEGAAPKESGGKSADAPATPPAKPSGGD